MRELQTTIQNLTINYRVFGEPVIHESLPKIKPLLILHGWGAGSLKWQPVAELVAAKNITVIVPDLPGFGQSQEPANAWNLDNYVSWLQEFTGHLPEFSNGFYLLGHSFGGALAAKFAVKHTQKVEKLFLVSAACIREKTVRKEILRQISKVVKLFSFLPYYAKARKAFYKIIIKKSDYPYVKGVMKETYLKIIAEDLLQYLSFVKVPTTIIWGDKDTITNITYAQAMNKKIEHSTLVVIADADHTLHQKFPEALVEKILEHL